MNEGIRYYISDFPRDRKKLGGPTVCGTVCRLDVGGKFGLFLVFCASCHAHRINANAAPAERYGSKVVAHLVATSLEQLILAL